MGHGMTGKRRVKKLPEKNEKSLTPSVCQVQEEDNCSQEPDGWPELVADFLLGVQATREEKTHEFYDCRLKGFIRWIQSEGVPLRDFKARHLRAFMMHRQKALNPKTGQSISDSTRRSDAIAARKLLAFAVQEGYLSVDPLKDYEIPKAAKTLGTCPADDDIQKLLKAAQDRWKPAMNPDCKFYHAPGRVFFQRRDYAILTGLLTTACRISEILNLRLSDIDLQSNTVHFRDTKGDEDRIVPFEPGWGKIVQEWLRSRPKASPSETLFVTEYGDALTVERFRHQYYKTCRFAGVTLNMHSLRHYGLTQIGKKGLFAAQKIAGHKNAATTQIYLHADAAHLADIHAQAAPLGRLLGDAPKPILVNKRSEANRRRKLV